jgi:hypothetical protein
MTGNQKKTHDFNDFYTYIPEEIAILGSRRVSG